MTIICSKKSSLYAIICLKCKNVFLTDTKKLKIECIPYGVMITIINIPDPSPSPSGDPENTTNGNMITAMPTNSTNGPTVRSDETSNEYSVTFTNGCTEIVKNFTGNSSNITQSMEPCTRYNFTVTTTVNGTQCLVGMESGTTENLSMLSYSTIRSVFNMVNIIS